MDLSQLDTSKLSDKGVPMHVEDYSGADTGVIIYLAGIDSEQSITATKQFYNDQNKRIGRNGKLNLPSYDEEERRKVDYLVNMTVGWENFEWQGEPVEFTRENAEWLYTYRGLRGVREQVDAFIGDRENFTKPSSTNSATTRSTSGG